MAFLIGLLIFCVGLGFYAASIPIAVMTFGGVFALAALLEAIVNYLHIKE